MTGYRAARNPIGLMRSRRAKTPPAVRRPARGGAGKPAHAFCSRRRRLCWIFPTARSFAQRSSRKLASRLRRQRQARSGAPYLAAERQAHDLETGCGVITSQRVVHGSLRKTLSPAVINVCGTEHRLAQLQKYRLAIEPIAACYALPTVKKAVHSGSFAV